MSIIHTICDFVLVSYNIAHYYFEGGLCGCGFMVKTAIVCLPQGPQWSSLDQSIFRWSCFSVCSIFHLPNNTEVLLRNSLGNKFQRFFIECSWLLDWIKEYVSMSISFTFSLFITNHITSE